jgi:hypothetical protein
VKARFVGLSFGILWLLVGATAAGVAAGIAIACVGLLMFTIVILRTRRQPDRQSRPFIRAYYMCSVAAEVAAIIAAQLWLAAHAREDLLWPAVGVIVGLHFIGLWLASSDRRFLWLTGAMVALNLAALLLPISTRERIMMSGFGSSACLLVSALS